MTRNIPETAETEVGRWCGRRDSDPGRWLSFLQWMEGQWTLSYVLDQIIRMLLARRRQSHALDYGRGRTFRASGGGNYAFARGEQDCLCSHQGMMHAPIAINPEG